ncbi:MAG TPA: hypothetical protein PLU80_18350, partial [Acidobacteriota bacterium]|nr:hypothetical protein [Acidobacteriota bacterium]
QRLRSDHQSFYGRLEDLPEGTHRISFVATDPAGNTTRVIRTVTVDVTPPVISRISPKHQAQITGTTTLIQGQLIDSTNVALTINDIRVIPESSGKFSVSVPICEGTNDFQLYMTDEAGNQSHLELTWLAGIPQTQIHQLFFQFNLQRVFVNKPLKALVSLGHKSLFLVMDNRLSRGLLLEPDYLLPM